MEKSSVDGNNSCHCRSFADLSDTFFKADMDRCCYGNNNNADNFKLLLFFYFHVAEATKLCVFKWRKLIQRVNKADLDQTHHHRVQSWMWLV